MKTDRKNRFLAYVGAGPVGPRPPCLTWDKLMDLAIEEARLAAAHGDVPVGAIIVAPDGEILAAAGNCVEAKHNPTGHAEIMAIQAAAARRGRKRLSGCVMVVTLEPCLMCAGAISQARLSGLVFGAADLLCGAIVSKCDYYDLPGSNRNLWCMGGVRALECAQILQDFFAEKRYRASCIEK